MKQFFSVLRFELAGYFKNKVYMGMTILLTLVVAVVLSFPTLKGWMSGPDAAGGPGTGEAMPSGTALAVVNGNTVFGEEALNTFVSSLYGFSVHVVEGDEAAVKERVAAGEFEGAAVLKSPMEATYIARSEGLYDNTAQMLSGALQAAYRMDRLAALGVSGEEAARILMPPVSVSMENLGVSQVETFFYTYALIFALYMAIMLYGQLVATSVATEKSSRTMELLITSTRPDSLLFGKVIGSGIAGLLQMAAVFGSAVLFYHINEAAWAGNAIIASIFNMPLPVLGFALLFFVLGYFLYAFLFGSVGSLASRTEDINTSTMPVLLGFVVAFMVVMTSMASGNIDNAVMRFCSYLPFTSPMAMFVRIAMSSPAWHEIVLSILILMATTAVIGVLAARVYRVGVLMYGKPPKLGELIQVLRSARKAGA